jgi:hypothetical protein
VSQYLLKGAQSLLEQYILPRLRPSKNSRRDAGGRSRPQRPDPASKTERG